MLGLPEFGSKVRVWPMPGRRAQMDERPVDRMGGGRFLPKSGAVVEWSPFHHSQLLHGMLLLHAPPCEKHDHGDKGGEDCKHCGRDPKAAQEYDVKRADGIKAAQDAKHEPHPTASPTPLEVLEMRKAEAEKPAEES